MRTLVIAFIMLMISTAALAQPQIIETESGISVSLTGDKNSNQNDEIPTPSSIIEEKPESPALSQLPTNQPDQPRPRSLDGILKFPEFSVVVISQAYGSTTFSIKIDAQNAGPGGIIMFDAVGKDRTGHELARAFFTSSIGPKQTQSFTRTTAVENNLADRIEKWELVDVFMKYK
jgi:hypothetical protein